MEHSSLSHGLSLTTLFLFAIFIIPISSIRPVVLLHDTDIDTNTQFIRTSCGATSYPDLCFTTLSSHAAQIQRSPKLLAAAALSETLKTVRFASTAMSKLSQDQPKGLTAMEAEALSDCIEELSDSVEELHRSINEMAVDDDQKKKKKKNKKKKKKSNGSAFGLRMNDIQTWVSAALTDEDTCVDGFSEKSMNGSLIKNTVRGHLLNVAHMTSNALALVNHYALLHS